MGDYAALIKGGSLRNAPDNGLFGDFSAENRLIQSKDASYLGAGFDAFPANIDGVISSVRKFVDFSGQTQPAVRNRKTVTDPDALHDAVQGIAGLHHLISIPLQGQRMKVGVLKGSVSVNWKIWIRFLRRRFQKRCRQ